jgi:hypothetical protein
VPLTSSRSDQVDVIGKGIPRTSSTWLFCLYPAIWLAKSRTVSRQARNARPCRLEQFVDPSDNVCLLAVSMVIDARRVSASSTDVGSSIFGDSTKK